MWRGFQFLYLMGTTIISVGGGPGLNYHPMCMFLTEDVERAQLNVRGNEVSIYGFSYKERHIREAMVQHFPIADNQDAFHIGMLHGSLAGDQTHAVYAPFTKDELLSKQYDYWALGHIHLRQSLHEEPTIVYPGNIQGRHRNERGVKGFYEVQLTKTETGLEFIPTSDLIFDRLEVSCTGISHANEWREACVEVIDTFKEQSGSGIVELKMTAIDGDAAELFSQSTEEEWLEILREVVMDSEPFVWVQSISFAHQQDPAALSSVLSQTVVGMMDDWTEKEWKGVLKDVYQHARGIKYLEGLTKEEIRAVKVDAEAILLAEFSRMK